MFYVTRQFKKTSINLKKLPFMSVLNTTRHLIYSHQTDNSVIRFYFYIIQNNGRFKSVSVEPL